MNLNWRPIYRYYYFYQLSYYRAHHYFEKNGVGKIYFPDFFLSLFILLIWHYFIVSLTFFTSKAETWNPLLPQEW